MKNAGSAIDAEVDEFLNAAPLDRYRLLLYVIDPLVSSHTYLNTFPLETVLTTVFLLVYDRHWWLTPHLRVLAQFQPNPDLSLINPNSELLKLPEKAFDSILEFLDLVRT